MADGNPITVTIPQCARTVTLSPDGTVMNVSTRLGQSSPIPGRATSECITMQLLSPTSLRTGQISTSVGTNTIQVR